LLGEPDARSRGEQPREIEERSPRCLPTVAIS